MWVCCDGDHGVDSALTISNGRRLRAVSKLDLVRLTGAGPGPTEIGTITSQRACGIAKAAPAGPSWRPPRLIQKDLPP